MKRQLKRWGVVTVALTAGIVFGVGLDRVLAAQQNGITRTELTRVDIPGCATHEAVMAIAEIAPGAASGRHFHHGVEIGYVLDGSFAVEHPDGSTTTVKQGQAFRNPVSEVHNGKTLGPKPVRILAVYVVEKGKPLAEPAPPGK